MRILQITPGARRLAMSGHEVVCREFTLSRMAQTLIDIYQDAAGGDA